MMLINIARWIEGGTFQAYKCGNDVHLPRIWTGNALKTGKMTRNPKKKKAFLEKHYF